MRDKIGIVLNRLTIGFTFAFIYQFIVGIATSIMMIPLTGNLQDLISGIKHIESGLGEAFIAWWVVSTMIITAVALLILRFKKQLSPYKGEKDIDVPPRITPLTALIVGGTVSFLFFMLDVILGAIVPTDEFTDVEAIYQAALHGNFVPLAMSLVFSFVAGSILVGIVGRTAHVKAIAEDAGLSRVASSLGKRIKKGGDGGGEARTTADTVGMAPGALVHIGEKKVDKVTFEVFTYDKNDVDEARPGTLEECLATIREGRTSWINVTGIHEADVIKAFGERFDLHELVQADIMNTEQRPKADLIGDNVFLVLKLPHFDAKTGRLAIEQISLVAGRGYLLSFQEVPSDVFGRIRKRLRAGGPVIRQHDSDYMAYLLADAIIDSFFAALENVGDVIDGLEERLMGDPGPSALQTIYLLKRQLIILRKIIWPSREAVDAFAKLPQPFVSEDTKTYLKDAYGHAVQAMDTTESLRDMVGGMLDTYMSIVGNRMNEVMKTLTIIASIFIPITFIAGLYGTNFPYVPELEIQWGYFGMLGVMGAISVLMVLWFRRKKWM